MPKYERMKRGFLKVNELAKVAAMPASTIRYYMRMGILKPVMDTKSGYHLYDQDESLKRLEMVHQIHAAKPTLEEAKRVVDQMFCGAQAA